MNKYKDYGFYIKLKDNETGEIGWLKSLSTIELTKDFDDYKMIIIDNSKNMINIDNDDRYEIIKKTSCVKLHKHYRLKLPNGKWWDYINRKEVDNPEDTNICPGGIRTVSQCNSYNATPIVID